MKNVRYIAQVLVLAVVYLLLMPGAATGDVLLAPIAGAAALELSRSRHAFAAKVFRGSVRAPINLALLIGSVLRDVSRGSWRLALASLGLRRLPITGIVEVPLGERSLMGAAVNGLLVTLSPGTALLGIDSKAGVMVFHVVADDPGELRKFVDRLYALQRQLVP